jgi:hypothetical protein
MPYTYEHIEVVDLDSSQRGLLNALFQSTWSGPPANVVSATLGGQAGSIKMLEVVGTRTYNEAQLPDPPVDIVDTDGSTFTVQLTERGALNAGQIVQLNNFIASVWPGAVGDVHRIEFMLVEGVMRTTLYGVLSAANANALPKGKRFRVRTRT